MAAREWRATRAWSCWTTRQIPYGIAPGNHDMNSAGVANGYDQYFPVSRMSGYSWYGGYLGQNLFSFTDPIDRHNKNNYSSCSRPAGWISSSSTSSTTCRVTRSPGRTGCSSVPEPAGHHQHASVPERLGHPADDSPESTTDGTPASTVWTNLIFPNCNVFLVLNGHYPGEANRHAIRPTLLASAGPPARVRLPEPRERRRWLASVHDIQAGREQDLRLHVLADAGRLGSSRPTPTASSCSTTTCRARRSRRLRRTRTSPRAPVRKLPGRAALRTLSTSGTRPSAMATRRSRGRRGRSRLPHGPGRRLRRSREPDDCVGPTAALSVVATGTAPLTLSVVSGDGARHDDAGRDQQRQLHDAGADRRDQLLGARHQQLRDGELDDRDDHDRRRAGDHDAAGEPDDRVAGDGGAERGGDGHGPELPVVSGDEPRHDDAGRDQQRELHDAGADDRDQLLGARHATPSGRRTRRPRRSRSASGPAITTQPASQTIASGATATLSVVATGTGL